MAVSVLDVAVSFSVDKTAADAAFDQLPGQAQRSFGEADAFAQRFNAVLDATAENIALAGERLPTLGQAFRTLRVTGPDHLKEGVDNASLAFQTLQESGVTASGTLLQAEIKLTEKQIAYNTAVGESAVALDAQLSSLKAQLAALNGVADANERAALAAKALADETKLATAQALEQAKAQEKIATASATISASTRAAAAEITPAWLKATEASLAYADAQKQVAAASLLVEESAGADAEAITLLAAAQERLAIVSLEVSEANKAVALSAKEEGSALDILSEKFVRAGEAGSVFGGLNALLGGSIVVGFLASFAGEAQKAVLELDHLAEKTGINVQALSGLQLKTKELGVDFSALETGLVRLGNAQALAVEGGKKQTAAFERIGISIKEVRDLTPEALLTRVSEALQQNSSSADVAATSIALFGRGGAALIPIFKEFGGELDNVIRKTGDQTGVNEEAVKAAKDWQKITTDISVEFRKLAIEILPVLTGALHELKTAFDFLQSSGISAFLKDAAARWYELGLATDVAGLKVRNAIVNMIPLPDATKLALHKAQAKELEDVYVRAGEDIQKALGNAIGVKLPEPPKLPNVPKLPGGDDEATAQAKRNLETQLAAIEEWKAGVHLAFATGETDAASWAVAQVRAADAADAAQENYHKRLITLSQQSGDATKVQAATQELATLQVKDAAKETEALAEAIRKHNEFSGKMAKDWSDLLQVNIGKTFNDTARAAEALVKAEEKLGEAQKNLQLAEVTKKFSAQIQAIQELASVGIISESDKASRLRDIYRQEEEAQLKSLRTLQEQQQSAVNVAKEKLNQATANPFAVNDAQRLQLQKDLDLVLAAYDNTQAEIIRRQTQFEEQRLQLQRGAVAEAIAIARGEGKEQIAAQIESNQTQLDSINANIALAKARGQDTRALQEQQKATEALIRSEIREVQSTKTLSTNMVELKKTLQETALEEIHAFGSAAAAAIAGQESFGAAMISGTLRVISTLAQHWADYFFAKAIADYFLSPATAVAEVAAAIALEAVAGVTSGLASKADASGQKSNTGTPEGLPPTQQSPATTAQQPPEQIINVQRFATGGITTRRMLAVVGDDIAGAGDAAEAIIPLGSNRAKEMFADTFLPSLLEAARRPESTPQTSPFSVGGLVSQKTLALVGNQVPPAPTPFGKDPVKFLEDFADKLSVAIGAGHLDFPEVHYHIKGDVIDHNQLMKKVTRAAKKGQGRLYATSAQRIVRS